MAMVAQERVEALKRMQEAANQFYRAAVTYVMGDDYYNSSPVDIIVTSERLTLMEWPYEVLRSMAKNQRFNAALQNGFVHSAGLKHGLLASPIKQGNARWS